MATITWTEEAQRWLEDIFEYIAADNPRAAAGTVNGIYAAAEGSYSRQVITFLILAAVLLVGLSLLVGIGVGIGFVLHWLLPAIDFGVGVLIGVVALAFMFQMVARLMMWPVEVEDAGEEAEEPRDVVYVVERMSGKSKRKRKGNR